MMRLTSMSITVRCPHCATDYLLPEALLGPGGARVRCPSCQKRFAVTRDGSVVPGSGPTAAAPGGTPAPVTEGTEGSREERIASMVLDELAAHRGRAIEDAVARGRPFAEHGPALLEAWDEYRRRAGKTADPAPFRAALRARWGIDLPGEGANRE